MKLHEKLALLRRKTRLTQMELAQEMDVSRQAVSRWETGISLPTTENLIHLSRLYQVPVEYLLNEDAEISTGEEHVPKEEAKEIRVPVRRVKGWVGLALLALIFGACAGYLIGKGGQNGEIYLSVEEMKGEEVDISSAERFTIETGW